MELSQDGRKVILRERGGQLGKDNSHDDTEKLKLR